MKLLKLTLLSLVLVADPFLRAEPAAAPPPAPAVTDPLAEALPILQARYSDFQSLNYKPGDKLEDIIARSAGGISLIAPDSLPPTPIITAALPDGVLYWRLATFTPKKTWADLGAELQTEIQHSTPAGAVLDLRSNDAPSDLHGASQIINFFAPGDDTLKHFNVKQVDRTILPDYLALNTHFDAPIIVLTDQRTSGAAEVLAACLKADGALVVGSPTAGRGADFTDLKLSSGQILRFVADHVHLSNGIDLWNHPVTPDISPAETDRNERAALTLIRDNQVLEVIQEEEARHRLSEATLVLGQDPEYDDYLSTLERKPVLLSLPVIHDEVLISALDSLKAIRFSQKETSGPTTTTSTTTVALPASTSIQ